MNQTETFIFKFFLWAIGIMVTAILGISTLTYQSQKETEQLIRNHMIDQAPKDQYTFRRFYNDSVNINRIESDISILKYWIKKNHPDAFSDEETEENKIVKPTSQAVIRENKYKLKHLNL